MNDLLRLTFLFLMLALINLADLLLLGTVLLILASSVVAGASNGRLLLINVGQKRFDYPSTKGQTRGY
jgi:hypothetical protein